MEMLTTKREFIKIAEKFPPEIVSEYLKAFKDDQKTTDELLRKNAHNFGSARSSVIDTPWDEWNAKDLSKTLAELALPNGYSKKRLMYPSKTDIYKPFVRPQSMKKVKGFFEIDTDVVELLNGRLISYPQFLNYETVKETGTGFCHSKVSRGVSVGFDRVEEYVKFWEMMDYINSGCNAHSSHSYIVNIHRSIDWELYESCFDLDGVFDSMDQSIPSLKEKFEKKIKFPASPRSKYSLTKRGNTRHSTVLGMEQKSVDNHQLKGNWREFSYEDGYINRRKDSDFFYFFEIFIVHPD